MDEKAGNLTDLVAGNVSGELAGNMAGEVASARHHPRQIPFGIHRYRK